MAKQVAVLLTGGRSSRFGSDKGAVVVAGETVAARLRRVAQQVADEVLAVGGPDGQVADLEPGGGPLQAVLAAARARPGCDLLVLACDLPLVSAELLRLLVQPLPGGTLARVPRLEQLPQPLTAFYGADSVPVIEEAWRTGRRSMQAVLDRLAIAWLAEADIRAAGVDPTQLRDFDTPADLAHLTGPPDGQDG